MKHSRLAMTLCLSLVFSLIFVQLPKAEARIDANNSLPLTQSRVFSSEPSAQQNHRAVFTNPAQINIPVVGTATPYPSSIVVSGLSGVIPNTPGSVNVNINDFSHQFPDDVNIVLVGPTGAALMLQGGAGDDTGVFDVSYTFSDTASSRLPCLGDLLIGIWFPTGCGSPGPTFPSPGPVSAYSVPGPAGGTATLGSTFGGTNPNGTWNLFVIDSKNGDSGSIAGGWSLEITTAAPQSQAKVSDFDGDGKADLAVFRPSNGTWYINGSTAGYSQSTFGFGSDTLVPADFDGDGKTDIAVFRSSNAQWYALKSSNGAFDTVSWGNTGDSALGGDYDGDGKADFITLRNSPAGAIWNVGIQSESGAMRTPTNWIIRAIITLILLLLSSLRLYSIVHDGDGDGKKDPTFWSGDGMWNQLRSADGSFHRTAWGTNGDQPVLGDFDGDGRDDHAVFRPSQNVWYILRSSDGSGTGVQFGTAGDVPVPADYDGDGKTDIAVFRPSSGAWYILQSTLGFRAELFGTTGDKPIPAEYVR